MIKLRYYQEEAINSAIKNDNGILVCPTGTGKSVIIAGICQKIKEPILILQPSKEILEQNFEKIKSFTAEDLGIYSASKGKKEINRITLATIGSIKDIEQFKHFKIILIDECHLVRSDAGKYCDFINEVKPTKIIGLTATPYRLKSWSGGYSWKFLHRTRPKIFNNIIYNYQIKQAFKDKFLCPLEYFKFDYDLTKLRQTKMDYTEDSVVEYNESINIYETIINIIKTNISRKYFLVFATTINEANKICNLLLKENINGYYVSSNNTRKEREEILNNFISGKVKFIINVGVLTTGFDFPELDCIILARPTKSLSLYYQMVGRGVRIAKDKNKCQVFDLCNNYETFGDLTTFEIEGDGAKTGLRNSDKWLIKPSLLSIKEAVNARKQNKNYFEVPFGKYKGRSIAEVPVSYINYCLDNFIDFKYKDQFEKALKSNF